MQFITPSASSTMHVRQRVARVRLQQLVLVVAGDDVDL